MERYFSLFEVDGEGNTLHCFKDFTESELKRRFERIVGYLNSDPHFSVTDWWWRTHVLPVLLHGEAEEKDEWIDFGQSLDEGLHQWSAGNGVGYLVETLRKMPEREKSCVSTR